MYSLLGAGKVCAVKQNVTSAESVHNPEQPQRSHREKAAQKPKKRHANTEGAIHTRDDASV
jgi:hypothetical protein